MKKDDNSGISNFLKTIINQGKNFSNLQKTFFMQNGLKFQQCVLEILFTRTTAF